MENKNIISIETSKGILSARERIDGDFKCIDIYMNDDMVVKVNFDEFMSRLSAYVYDDNNEDFEPSRIDIDLDIESEEEMEE